MVGVVTDLDDPERLGRVEVRYPHLERRSESDWARLATPMAGPDRGTLLPAGGRATRCSCAFEHGDPRRPYVLGGLWSKADPPPADDGDQATNNWRFIHSRSGHVVTLDDTAGRREDRAHRQGRQAPRRHRQRRQEDRGDVRRPATSRSTRRDGHVTIEATSIELTASGDDRDPGGAQLTLKGAPGRRST